MQTTRPPSTDTPERPLPAEDVPEGHPRQRVGQTGGGPNRGGAPRAPRHTRWFVALGFTLLAASAIGTGVVLRSQAHDGQSADTSPSGDVPSAYGDGFVDVEGRVIELYPKLPGGPNQVIEVLVQENDHVQKDGVLLRLDPRQALFQVAQAEADLKASQKKLAQTKRAPAQHEKLIEQQKAAVGAAKKDLASARSSAELAEKQYGGEKGPHLITKAERDIALNKVESAEWVVRGAEAKLTALELLKDSLQDEIGKAQQDVASKQAQVGLAKNALEQCELKAPVDGKVLRLTVTVGQLLGPQPREPAIFFCPNKPRIVRAEISQEFANQVKVGQLAIVTDDATLTGEWRGKVKSLSDWFAPKRHQLFEPRQMNDVRTLEAVIELDPEQSKDLRIGQRVRVKLEKK